MMDDAHGHGTWAGRVEDDALLRGQGRYSDDMKEAGAAAAVFVRATHARAGIRKVDTQAARAMSGVIAILTADDIAEFNPGSVSGAVPLPFWQGKPGISPFRPVLARDKVAHIGELIAVVVAETAAQAQDAADIVEVAYDPQTPVIDLQDAIAGNEQIWPEAPGNLALDWHTPPDPDGAKKAEIDAIFAGAAHVASVETFNQRISVVAMEPRAATASYDAQSDAYTLRTGTQGVAGIRGQTIGCMKIPPNKLRVVNNDVGGGFGMKASGYPEYPALLYAARKIERPVHWTATRAESFISDNQARDSLWKIDLALDANGKFLALRVRGEADMGAYLTGVALYCPTVHISGCLPSVYDIPKISVATKCYFSNKVAIGPYRGAGRPEVNHFMERVVDAAATKLGLDPAEVRRRNLIPASRMPYASPTGVTYDSGDFPAVFEKALKAADYAGFPKRRAESKARGKLRGVGIGCFVEISGGVMDESATIKFGPGDKVTFGMGATPNGQGHVTVFGQLMADRFGIPRSAVDVQFGDSARDIPGFGAVASRSAMLVGGALAVSTDLVIAKGRKVAAILLQGAEDQIEYANGVFSVRGADAQASLFEVAARSVELAKQGVIPESLDTKGDVKTGPSFPNGCHIAEVEVDAETGAVEIVAYTSVDDCGVVLNDTIVSGQIHGGVAQGIGQALGEYTVYDRDSGQILSGSLMDYTMPRAADLPKMQTLHHPVACTTNPLGVKGTGEAGTTAAPPTIVNAVANAIGVTDQSKLEMPLTPQRVWRAMQG